MENRQELKDAVKNLIVKQLADDILKQEKDKFDALKKELSIELTKVKPDAVKEAINPIIPSTPGEKKMQEKLGFFMKEEFAKAFQARLDGIRAMNKKESTSSPFDREIFNPFAESTKKMNIDESMNLSMIDKLRASLSKSKTGFPEKLKMNDLNDKVYFGDENPNATNNFNSMPTIDESTKKDLPPSADTILYEFKSSLKSSEEIAKLEKESKKEFDLGTKKKAKKVIIKKAIKKPVKKTTKKVTAASKPKNKK